MIGSRADLATGSGQSVFTEGSKGNEGGCEEAKGAKRGEVLQEATEFTEADGCEEATRRGAIL